MSDTHEIIECACKQQMEQPTALTLYTTSQCYAYAIWHMRVQVDGTLQGCSALAQTIHCAGTTVSREDQQAWYH